MKKILGILLLSLTVSSVLSAEEPAAPGNMPGAAPATVEPAAPAAAGSGLSVAKIGVGTGVEERELVGEAASFYSSVDRVYCWTRLSASVVPSTVKHVWSMNGQKISEVPLDVKYASMRTWSTHGVTPGDWKVEVTDESGSVLSSVSFTVGGAPATPAAPANPQ